MTEQLWGQVGELIKDKVRLQKEVDRLRAENDRLSVSLRQAIKERNEYFVDSLHNDLQGIIDEWKAEYFEADND